MVGQHTTKLGRLYYKDYFWIVLGGRFINQLRRHIQRNEQILGQRMKQLHRRTQLIWFKQVDALGDCVNTCETDNSSQAVSQN